MCYTIACWCWDLCAEAKEDRKKVRITCRPAKACWKWAIRAVSSSVQVVWEPVQLRISEGPKFKGCSDGIYQCCLWVSVCDAGSEGLLSAHLVVEELLVCGGEVDPWCLDALAELRTIDTPGCVRAEDEWSEEGIMHCGLVGVNDLRSLFIHLW